ncbi:hypothetical protein NE237_020538 [Protea cynaroides]|uniref:GIL1/IRKI C-terminal domain-containing protein n=1 Tax=Protea cynaroides TaxID=273540 RepID=A0A9Q0H6U4_9MAGN|nr:hypothetical protein NE237_020538 [Protea cynaroides]
MFVEIVKRVWLLHCLSFSFELDASIFQVRRGCRFFKVYMETVAKDDVLSLPMDMAGVIVDLLQLVQALLHFLQQIIQQINRDVYYSLFPFQSSNTVDEIDVEEANNKSVSECSPESPQELSRIVNGNQGTELGRIVSPETESGLNARLRKFLPF